MPGQRRLHRDLGGFVVADFADHHHVGVLPQNRAQARREGQPDARIDLRLPHPVDRVFDRVLDRQDVARAVISGGVELAQRGIKRGGLARSGRAGHQHDAVGFGQRAGQYRCRLIGQAQVREIEPGLVLVEQPQHHALARPAGQRRNAHVDQPPTQAQRDPPVLRHPPLGNIEPCHDLDPADQDRRDVRRHAQCFLEHAIVTHPHDQRALVRFDMNIRDALPHALGDQPVDQPDRRCIVGRIEQVLGARQSQRERVDAFEAHAIRDRSRRAIDCISLAQQPLECRRIDRFDRQRPAQHAAQFDQVERIGAISHREPGGSVIVAQHQEPAIAREGVRQRRDGVSEGWHHGPFGGNSPASSAAAGAAVSASARGRITTSPGCAGATGKAAPM